MADYVNLCLIVMYVRHAESERGGGRRGRGVSTARVRDVTTGRKRFSGICARSRPALRTRVFQQRHVRATPVFLSSSRRISSEGRPRRSPVTACHGRRLSISGSFWCARTTSFVFGAGAQQQPALVSAPQADWLLSPNVTRLRVRPTAEIDPLYLHAYLGVQHAREWMSHRAAATAAPSLSSAVRGRRPLRFPPIEQQCRCVELLGDLGRRAEAYAAYASARRPVTGRTRCAPAAWFGRTAVTAFRQPTTAALSPLFSREP